MVCPKDLCRFNLAGVRLTLNLSSAQSLVEFQLEPILLNWVNIINEAKANLGSLIYKTMYKKGADSQPKLKPSS